MRFCKFTKGFLPYGVFLIYGLVFLAKPVLDMDEIWNYGFASYIADGLHPYVDFNMIQTPLSAYLASAVLLMFGNNLIVFRILGAVLFSVTFGLVYSVGLKVVGNRALAFTLSSFLGVLCSLVWMYNYNHLILLCILAVMFCEYQTENKNGVRVYVINVVIGLIYGVTPIIKQSTGAILILFNVVCCIWKLVLKKTDCRIPIIRISVSLLPSALFVVGVLISGTFAEFFDYAVRGVQTFTLRQTWFGYIMTGPIDFVVGLIPLGVTLVSLFVLIKGKSRISATFHVGTLMLSWAGAMVAYPICDFVHACIAAVPFLIPLLCCIGELRISYRDGVACCLVAGLVLCCSSALILKDLPKYKLCELPCFAGLPISPEIEAQIQTVDAYLLDASKDGVDVIIADEDAAAYMIPVQKYYKDFNLLLVGNVGTNSVDDLLWRENAIYLVATNEESLGIQAHTDLIAYIKGNYTKIGEVLGFDAYAP